MLDWLFNTPINSDLPFVTSFSGWIVLALLGLNTLLLLILIMVKAGEITIRTNDEDYFVKRLMAKAKLEEEREARKRGSSST
jgi:hypothetical protein